MKKIRLLSVVCLIGTLLVACGGGGGGGGSDAVTPVSSSTTSGGTTSSGNAAGGSSSGGTSAGLSVGGVNLVVDVAASGVGLDVQGSGTGAVMQIGDIQGFSSIILNDDVVNIDAATIRVEGEVAAQDDLRQGQQVLVVSDDSGTVASDVLYRSNVKGEITEIRGVDTALGTGTLVVLGQTVRLDAATSYFDTDLAALAVGQLVEISGTLNDAGEIRASFVEVQQTLAEFKVIGTISDSTANGFSLNALNVDISSATLSDFDGAPVDGDVVEVKADPSGFTAPDQLVATRVERLPTLTLGASAQVRVEGFIDAFTSASNFSLQGIALTTDSNTSYVNGSEASLGLGVKVQVVGNTQQDGVVLASSITIQPTGAIRAEGPIEAIDGDARTLTVLGIPFVTRDALRLEDDSSAGVEPLTFNGLGIGDEVEVRGYLDGSTVVASRIERDDPRDRARLRGPVGAEDAASGTLEVLGVALAGQAGVTTYQAADDSVITQVQFHDAVELGTFVQARWDVFVGTDQVVDELSIED